jgi:hypothetical protein
VQQDVVELAHDLTVEEAPVARQGQRRELLAGAAGEIAQHRVVAADVGGEILLAHAGDGAAVLVVKLAEQPRLEATGAQRSERARQAGVEPRQLRPQSLGPSIAGLAEDPGTDAPVGMGLLDHQLKLGVERLEALGARRLAAQQPRGRLLRVASRAVHLRQAEQSCAALDRVERAENRAELGARRCRLGGPVGDELLAHRARGIDLIEEGGEGAVFDLQ